MFKATSEVVDDASTTAATTTTTTTTTETTSTSPAITTAPVTTAPTTTSITTTTPKRQNITDRLSTFSNFFEDEKLDTNDMQLEFNKIENKLVDIFETNTIPNNASKDQISSGKIKIKGEEITVSKKAQDFTFELSSLLNLDQILTFILIREYSTSSGNKKLNYDKSEIFNILDYYYNERASLLCILGSIIKKESSGSKYSSFLKPFIEKNRDQIESRLLSYLISFYNFTIPSNLPELQQCYCSLVIKEQLIIAETLFSYNYLKKKNTNKNNDSSKDLLVILKLINQLSIGSYSDQLIGVLNLMKRNNETTLWLKRIEYTLVLLVFCSNIELYTLESLQQSQQELINIITTLSTSVHYNSPIATCCFFTIINLFISTSKSTTTSNEDTLFKSLKEHFIKASNQSDPIDYIYNCLSNGFNDSNYLAGYCDCIHVFLNRFSETVSFSDVSVVHIDKIIDIYCMIHEKGGIELSAMLWNERGTDPIYQYSVSTECLNRNPDKIISILKSIMVDDKSSQAVFNELLVIDINQSSNKQIITIEDFNRIIKPMLDLENNGNNNDRISGCMKRELITNSFRLYNAQFKSFKYCQVSAGNGSQQGVEVIFTLHDLILDLVSIEFNSFLDSLEQQAFFDSRTVEVSKAYIVVLDLISKLVEYTPDSYANYFWELFEKNKILESIIQVYLKLCNQQNFTVNSIPTNLVNNNHNSKFNSNMYGSSNSNSNNNRTTTSTASPFINNFDIITNVIKSILSLFTAFSKVNPLPILNLLIEKGICSSNPTEMISLFKRSSFNHLYDVEKRSSTTIKSYSSSGVSGSGGESTNSTFPLTKSIISLFNTFINPLNPFEHCIGKSQYLGYIESFISFHLQVVSDYPIISGNNNHVETWDIICSIYSSLELILNKSQSRNSILQPLAYKIILAFSSIGILQCTLSSLLDLESLQNTNKSIDRTLSIDNILKSSLSFSKSILSTIYLSIIYQRSNVVGNNTGNNSTMVYTHNLVEQFINSFFQVKQNETNLTLANQTQTTSASTATTDKTDYNNLFIILFNYINIITDCEDIQVLSCEILSSIVRILRVTDSNFSISTLFNTNEPFSLLVEKFSKKFIISGIEFDIWSPLLKTNILRLLVESSTNQISFINRIISIGGNGTGEEGNGDSSFLIQLLLNRNISIIDNSELSLTLIQLINSLYCNSIYYDGFVDQLNCNQEFWNLLFDMQSSLKCLPQDSNIIKICKTLKITMSIEILSLAILLNDNNGNNSNMVTSDSSRLKWTQSFKSNKNIETMINDGYFKFMDLQKVYPIQKLNEFVTGNGTDQIPRPDKLQTDIAYKYFPNVNNSVPIVEIFSIDNIIASNQLSVLPEMYIQQLILRNELELLTTSYLCCSRSFSKFFRVILLKQPQFFIGSGGQGSQGVGYLSLLDTLVCKAKEIEDCSIQTTVVRNDLLMFLSESISTVCDLWCKSSPGELIDLGILNKLLNLLTQVSSNPMIDHSISYLLLTSILTLVENPPPPTNQQGKSIGVQIFNQLINTLSIFITDQQYRVPPQTNTNGSNGNGGVGNNVNDLNKKKKSLPSVCNLSISILQALVDRLDKNSLLVAFPHKLLENLSKLLCDSLNMVNNHEIDSITSTCILNLLISFCKQPLISESLLDNRFIILLSDNSLNYLKHSHNPYVNDSGSIVGSGTSSPAVVANRNNNGTHTLSTISFNDHDKNKQFTNQKKNKWHAVWTLVIKFLISISVPLEPSERFMEQLSNFIHSHKDRLFSYFESPSEFGATQHSQYFTRVWYQQLEYITSLISIFSKYTKRYYLSMGIFHEFLILSYRLLVSLNSQCSELSFIEYNFNAITKSEKQLNQIQITEFIDHHLQDTEKLQLAQQQQQQSQSTYKTSQYQQQQQLQQLQQQQKIAQQQQNNSIFKFSIESTYLNIINHCFNTLIRIMEFIKPTYEFLPELTTYPNQVSFSTFGQLSIYIMSKLYQINSIKSGSSSGSGTSNSSISINELLDLNQYKIKIKQIAEKNTLLLILHCKITQPSTSQQETFRENQVNNIISHLINQQQQFNGGDEFLNFLTNLFKAK